MVRSVVIGVAVKMAGAGGTLEHSDAPPTEMEWVRDRRSSPLPRAGGNSGPADLSDPSTALTNVTAQAPTENSASTRWRASRPIRWRSSGSAARARTDVTHSLGRHGQEAGGSGLDQVGLHADRIGHDGEPGGLVLEDLQPALAAAPGVVRQPANPDVPGGQLVRPAPGPMGPGRPESWRSWGTGRR